MNKFKKFILILLPLSVVVAVLTYMLSLLSGVEVFQSESTDPYVTGTRNLNKKQKGLYGIYQIDNYSKYANFGSYLAQKLPNVVFKNHAYIPLKVDGEFVMESDHLVLNISSYERFYIMEDPNLLNESCNQALKKSILKISAVTETSPFPILIGSIKKQNFVDLLTGTDLGKEGVGTALFISENGKYLTPSISISTGFHDHFASYISIECFYSLQTHRVEKFGVTKSSTLVGP